MLKAKLNELVVRLDLVPQGPLLVKGREKSREERERLAQVQGEAPPSIEWIKVGDRPFIPGSSLKGVFRSHSEKMASSLAGDWGCCNPFVSVGEALKSVGQEALFQSWAASCSDKFAYRKEEANGPTVYADACPVCKLFGCGKLAGRLTFDDAYLAKEDDPAKCLETRDGVGINRFTGAASEGIKYQLRVMVKGKFEMTCYLRNFERWQAGLLVSLLRELAEQRVRIGYGKRRGMGKVNSQIKKLSLIYYGSYPAGCSEAKPIIAGIGSLAGTWLERREEYVFSDSVDMPLLPLEGAYQRSFSLPTDLNSPIWEALVQDWCGYIKKYALPEKMVSAYFTPREVQTDA